MRFMKLYRFAGNNERLKAIASELNQREYAVIPSEILDEVCIMLAEAEVYHLLTDRKKDEATVVLYTNMHDYHKGLAQLQEPVIGMASQDFDVKHPLSNRRLTVKKGDRFVVLELGDIDAKVKFVEGEAERKSYCLDRMLLKIS